jgi:hypothetical protein
MDPDYLVSIAIRPLVRQPAGWGLKHDIGTNVTLFFRPSLSPADTLYWDKSAGA